jgi:predicted ATPase
VLVSGAAAGLLPTPPLPGATLRDLGEHRLKDLPEPMRLFDLVVDGLESDFPPIRSLGRGNLPEPLTSFVGREREITDIAGLLERSRIVTLTGPGGTGKTRLSIEVARRRDDEFPDGAWFVPLETVTDPDMVLPAIGHSLGVREDASRPLADSLAEALGQRRLLLVLDNLEQVVAAAPAIGGLLRAAQAPRVLCSSREALRISGEQEYPVPPLDSDPAIELFIERARAVRPDFDPSEEDRETIAQICLAVDDLPLAIELAAARIRLFPLLTLLTRLTDRLATLQSTARDLPERQRTLRGAIDWSYDLLDEVEREVFARLSVFVGGAGLAAVDGVIDPAEELGADIIGVLGSLIDKSLLRPEDMPGAEPRFRMLETIRGYGFERLAGSAAIRPVRDRHLAFFLGLAEAFEPLYTGKDPETAFNSVSADNDNIRAAIAWAIEGGNVAAGLRICGAMWRFWQQRGRLSEGRGLIEQLISAPGARDDPAALARALTAYGGVVYWQGDNSLARKTYEEALELYRSSGDDRRTAMGLFDLAFTVSIDRDLAEADALFDESLAIYHKLGDERGWLMVGEGKAAVALIAGRFTEAREIAAGLVPDYRRLGMTYRLADILGLLAAIEIQLKEPDRARAWVRQAIELYKQIGDVSADAAVLQFGASFLLLEDRAADAARLLGALQAKRDRGEPFLTPAEIVGLTDPEALARAALTPAEFDVAFEEGRAWPREQAIDFAGS